MVLGAAVEAMVSSPLALVITAAAAVVALAVIRVLANTFHGSKPPIFEGFPFVGGLMKFAGVSGGRVELRVRLRHPKLWLRQLPRSRL